MALFCPDAMAWGTVGEWTVGIGTLTLSLVTAKIALESRGSRARTAALVAFNVLLRAQGVFASARLVLDMSSDNETARTAIWMLIQDFDLVQLSSLSNLAVDAPPRVVDHIATCSTAAGPATITAAPGNCSG